jgi:hypothetical protein
MAYICSLSDLPMQIRPFCTIKRTLGQSAEQRFACACRVYLVGLLDVANLFPGNSERKRSGEACTGQGQKTITRSVSSVVCYLREASGSSDWRLNCASATTAGQAHMYKRARA